MTLAEALDGHIPVARGLVCTICKILVSLPADELKALTAALDNRSRFSGSSIERMLRAEGYPAGGGAVNRHRRGECR